MRLPLRSLALLPAVLVFMGAFTAQAGKTARSRPSHHSSQVRTERVGAPATQARVERMGIPTVQATACTLGFSAVVDRVIDYIIPPDDAYYTLFRLDDCIDCQFTDTAIVRKVHVGLEWDAPCSTMVDIYFVGATGPADCPYPDITRILSPPQRFVLSATSITDPIDYELTLPESAMVFQTNFLVVSFADTFPGCAVFPNKPVLPMGDDGDCIQCRSWNVIDADPELDDMCSPGPDSVGNPRMYAVIDTCFPHRDPSPPSRITDFAVDSVRTNTIGFSWTAPGDNGTVGQAFTYDMRRSLTPIDSLNWNAATPVPGLPAPQTSGSPESHVVTGLPEATRMYFAIRGRDDTGNIGPLSNVEDTTSGVVPPAAITNVVVVPPPTENSVRLRWTASGDDGMVGRPLRYLIAASTTPLNESVFASARKESLLASVDAGGIENFNFPGLPRATTFYFAVKARDDVGGFGAISNVVTARTQVGGPLIGQEGPAIASLSNPERLPVEIFWVGVGSGLSQNIRIHDLSGRVARTIALGTEASGVAIWDGRNDDGEELPSGVYVARLTSGSAHANTRIIFLK